MWNTREREESMVNLRLAASAAQSIEFTLDEVSCFEGKDRRSVLDMLNLKCLLDLQMEL